MSEEADDLNAADTDDGTHAFMPHQFSSLDDERRKAGGGGELHSFDTIKRIPVLVQVVLGSATMPVAALMKLGRGAVVPLDHRVGEPVDVVVNGRVIARGEVVVVEDDNSRFGVQLTEIVGPSTDDAVV
ncbi:flagellar motor switch protein FliN/FliY [Pseudochelatococcus lubricantis]|uniref:Flagellar motor switch protein FliN n=1 Tax=Pseudochelatococcus lubricantis TaxID=1538102 RepID=A0ABX0V214_9HYPH|nr:flagellar motor switch protein FliN [Pseudochelatococcus lubricantis]NIJ57111.1 flagellar motor switch protein FliN/FliY [Pseudochelatococcus lubricantis]